eukprot:6175189-Pleurochrysis_carterae.AAC.1
MSPIYLEVLVVEGTKQGPSARNKRRLSRAGVTGKSSLSRPTPMLCRHPLPADVPFRIGSPNAKAKRRGPRQQPPPKCAHPRSE